MAKVFRLHPEGKNTTIDWLDSEKYGTDVINQINDPEGASARKEITSIPSPFARIDLVKTAFKKIVDERMLEGHTIYHKMVSDSFDVGEIFFNVDKLKDKIEVIIWDKENDLKKLLDSSTEAHQNLGKTLNMFLGEDAQAYNFNKLKRIYLLNYIGKGKPAKMNIIGATSPSTLFFSSANNLMYISEHIQFGQDKVFDNDYQALYKRDFEFQKYLYAFRESYDDFVTDFPEVYEYLELNYEKLSDNQKRIVDSLTKESIKEYEPVAIGANQVEVLGHPFHKKPIQEEIISDFEIKSDIFTGKKPLILPVESGNSYAEMQYTQSNWHKDYKAPYFDDETWTERTLPIVEDKYPYLTISDFLEDTVIHMPFELNAEAYFDGNISKSNEGSYLLPLNDLFFNFFTVEELKGDMPNGKKMFEMHELAGNTGISVTLRIPIKKGYIEYNRIYFTNNEADLKQNKGGIIEKRFGLGIFPLIKFVKGEKVHYRIALFDKGERDVNIKFFNDTYSVSEKTKIKRREKSDVSSVESYILEDVFDRLKVQAGNKKGMIIPLWKKFSEGNKKFTFAIDFGTTNTHIEYSEDGKPSHPLKITKEDKQMERLHIKYPKHPDIEYAFDDNFIPDTVGASDMYSFPLRSVFAEWENIEYEQPVFTLASGNIPFRYEKMPMPLYNKAVTDLKWSVKEQRRVELYLENIFFLLSNKVLLNGGKLRDTKIVWFYPTSMTEAHRNKYKTIWNNLYKEYFGDNKTNVITMSESVAPYYFYRKRKGAKSNVVTIDIGGGSTDVYVVENNKPEMLTSFRFASNAIFGDGYNWDADNNGFVDTFQEEIDAILGKNKLNDLQLTLSSISESKLSVDIVAFLFALSSNKVVKDKNITSLDFLQKLSDHDKLKYVFILFYTSIFYYVAHTMKAKGLQMPYTIAFSGNGSKTLKVLSEEKSTLEHFIKIIFENIYGQTYDPNNNLQIIYEENPKEATCKGGILSPYIEESDKTEKLKTSLLESEEVEKLKASLLGIDKKTFVHNKKYKDIDESQQKEICREVEEFLMFTFNLHRNNNSFFSKKFGADASILDQVEQISKQDISEYLKSGIEQQEKAQTLLGADDNIEETLFFYPLVGVLNNLARELSKINQ